MSRLLLRTVPGGLLTLMAVGCAVAGGSYDVSVGDRTTLMYGWENRFAIEWAVEPDTPQTRAVRGAVFNRGPGGADRMRVLVQASDPAGHPVAQRLVWLTTGVSGATGSSFEARSLPVADHYQVTVWDYTTLESVGNLR